MRCTLIASILFVQLFVSACQQSSNHPPETEDLDSSADRIVTLKRSDDERRLRMLALSGNSILNTPPEENFQHTTFKSRRSETCFDTSNLQAPWYFVDRSHHKPAREAAGDFLIAAPSTALDIPFYKINLNRPVDYEFVTPFQEFVYVWISAVKTDFDVEAYTAAITLSEAVKTGYYKKIDFDFTHNDSWPLTAFSNHESGALGIMLSNEEKNVSVRFRQNISIISRDEIKLSWQPTKVGDLIAPYRGLAAKGRFVHDSKKAVVTFYVSARAIPDSPRILESVNDAVDDLLISCDGTP